MKRLVLILPLVAILVSTVHAQKALSASQGWVKAPAAGETSALAYALVDNPTMYDVYLVSASSDVAGKVEFRQAKPGAAPDTPEAVTAPAYGKLELKADGIYLLLTDLKHPLKPGETVYITVMTDGGLAIEVAAEVRAQ